MIGLLGVALALGLLIFLAYRGVSVILLGPIMALLAVAFAGGAPLLANYTQVFMPAVGGFIITYFPLFLLGAIFGKLMDDSGAALSIAHTISRALGPSRSILAVVLACTLLTYGGVSLFVVAFAVYPIAVALFREQSIPKRLMPATIALGAFTFTMTALPGTPSIQNAIPMPFFGTTLFAAPGLGIIASLIMFLGGQWWLERQASIAKAVGEGYGAHNALASTATSEDDMRLSAHAEGFDIAEIAPEKEQDTPSFWLAVAPIGLVLILNYVLSARVFPAMDTSYLAYAQFGETSIGEVRGIWAIVCALGAAGVFIVATNWRRIANVRRALDSGADAAVLPIFNTASLVGFGAVIAALPAFGLIQGALEEVGGGLLVSLSLSVGVLAGVTGSASGGMSIALQALGDQYMTLAAAQGMAPELLHRVTTIATGSLDSLPHSGAVVTLLAICGLTHREAYGNLFMVVVAFPLLALIVTVILGGLFGAF